MLAFLIGFRSSWEKLERRSSATKVVLVLCVEKSVKRQICFGLTFGLKECPICFLSKIRKILKTTVFGLKSTKFVFDLGLKKCPICFPSKIWKILKTTVFGPKSTKFVFGLGLKKCPICIPSKIWKILKQR